MILLEEPRKVRKGQKKLQRSYYLLFKDLKFTNRSNPASKKTSHLPFVNKLLKPRQESNKHKLL